MKDEAFCTHCGSQLQQTLFPASILFACGVCEKTDCLSVRSEYEKNPDDECLNLVRLVGSNLEWTEISDHAIISTIFYKNYGIVPIFCFDIKGKM